MSPPAKITGEVAGKAIDALLTFLRSSAKHQKAQLFEHEDFLYLHLSLLHFPSKSRTNPFIIPLPHSLHPLDPSRTSLCLISSSSSLESLKSTASSQNLPFDSIISLSDLRANYVAFESRRKLCDSYDIFFADRRVLPLLPKLIGNYFFKKRKIPIGVDLSRKGWPEAVRRVCGSTQMFLGKGTSLGMKVGRVWMDRGEIVDNVMAGIEGAVKCVPKKWGNVRCVYVKAAHSVSLPIYQVVPEMGMKIVVREEEEEKGVGMKKRRGRIHDLDYVGGREEKEKEKKKKEVKEVKFDEFVELGDGGKMRKRAKKIVTSEKEKEKKKKVKEVKFDEFVELGDGGKMRKRAKRIVKSEMEEGGIKGGLGVDTIDGNDEDDRGDDEGNFMKKRRGRIHDLDYVDGKEEEEKKKKEVKEVKFDEFIELGDGGKMRKRAKRIVKLEVEEGGIKRGVGVDAIVENDEDDYGDDEGSFMKKKVRGKSAKGKKEANVMNGDGDHVDVEDSGKRVKKKERIGKYKVKKVKKIKLRQGA